MRGMVTEKKNKDIFEHIDTLSIDDINGLLKAQKSYGDSWKRRGGVGAFMMLARKWDRISNQCKANNWDIFKTIEFDPSNTGILDDIRDLRRYLLLVHGEMAKNGYADPGSID